MDKYTIRVFGVVLTILLLYILANQSSSFANQIEPSSTIRWQYKVVGHFSHSDAHIVEKAFNELGQEGWELCDTASNVSGKTNGIFNGSGGSGSVKSKLYYVFKRQLPVHDSNPSTSD